jgi:hypothetical protein
LQSFKQTLEIYGRCHIREKERGEDWILKSEAWKIQGIKLMFQ